MSEGDRIAVRERFEACPSRFEITRLLASKYKPADFWLWDNQARAIYTIAKFGSAFLPLDCGDGKSILSFLAFNVLAAERGLLFTKKSLVADTHPKIRNTRNWWQFETKRGELKLGYANFTVVNYDKLSSYSRTTLQPTLDLFARKPDVFVFDEAHMLCNKESARFAALDEYLDAYPKTPVIVLTGSPTTSSILEYEPLLKWCLKHDIPIPRDFPGKQSFAAVLDSRRKMPPNDLDYDAIDPVRRHFAKPEDYAAEKIQLDHFSGYSDEQKVMVVRKAFHRRLKTWPGIVMSSEESGVGVSLRMWREPIVVPQKVLDAYNDVDTKEERPDGELLVDAPLVALNKLHVSCAFYHQWRWPGGKKDEEWLRARKGYFKELRQALKPRFRGADTALKIELRLRKLLGLDKTGVELLTGDDNPEDPAGLLAKESAEVDFVKTEFEPSDDLIEAYKVWCQFKMRKQPPIEIVWIDKFFIKHIQHMLNTKLKHENVIVWYYSKAMEQGLAEIDVVHKGKHRKLPVYKAGAKTPTEGEQCAMSLAHATGKEFQHQWNHCIIAEYPRGGGIGGGGTGMQQMLSRLHRPGQTKDVEVYHFEHTEAFANALRTAREDAEYQSLTIGKQKLRIAEFLHGTT